MVVHCYYTGTALVLANGPSTSAIPMRYQHSVHAVCMDASESECIRGAHTSRRARNFGRPTRPGLRAAPKRPPGPGRPPETPPQASPNCRCHQPPHPRAPPPPPTPTAPAPSHGGAAPKQSVSERRMSAEDSPMWAVAMPSACRGLTGRCDDARIRRRRRLRAAGASAHPGGRSSRTDRVVKSGRQKGSPLAPPSCPLFRGASHTERRPGTRRSSAGRPEAPIPRRRIPHIKLCNVDQCRCTSDQRLRQYCTA